MVPRDLVSVAIAHLHPSTRAQFAAPPLKRADKDGPQFIGHCEGSE